MDYGEASARLHDFAHFRRHLRIQDRDTHRMVPLEPSSIQQKVRDSIIAAEREGRPARSIVLKARREGVSTIVQGTFCHRGCTRAGFRARTIADDHEKASNLHGMLEQMYTNLPKQLKPDKVSTRAGRELRLSNGSIFKTETAKDAHAGRSAASSGLHACLTPTTSVLVDDGTVIPAASVRPGDRVVTHLGHATTVTAVTESIPGSHNGAGETVIVQPWLSEPIELTPNHRVWTRRGWVAAGDLTLSDEVSMPVREITRTRRYVRLSPQKKRPQGGGRKAIGENSYIYLTEEVGFAIGYYLAEGTVTLNRQGMPSSITFSRHRNEVAYADRAIAAFAHVSRKRRTYDSPNSLTTTDTINGAPLATMLARDFGQTRSKRIPDWVFQAGRPFCEGLLAGYLSGDGSKTQVLVNRKYEAARMTATSICPSIIYQIRDLAASLGYGWGSVRRAEAGLRFGRNEQAAWTIYWGGRAARGLRELVGLAVPSTGKSYVEKAKIEDGHAWLRLRRLERGKTEVVYDIEVEHEDHSFRTASFAVANSEFAFWDYPENTLVAMLQTVPDAVGTIVVIESTAFGMGNAFHNEWLRAVRGESGYDPLFFSWLDDPGYDHGPHVTLASLEEIDDEEHFLLEELGATPGQIAWRRHKLARDLLGDLDLFHQEYPATADEAFLSTGRLFFDRGAINRFHPAEPIGRFELEGHFVRGKKSEKKAVRDKRGRLWIYELPQKETRYLIFVDPAGVVGEQRAQHFRAGEDPSDYTCMWVVNCKTMATAAVWHGRIDLGLAGIEAAKLGVLYGRPNGCTSNAVICPETTGGYGFVLVEKLREIGYSPIHRDRVRNRYDRHRVDTYGWATTTATRPLILETLRDVLRQDPGLLKHAGLKDEMQSFVIGKSNDKATAAPGCHDDMVMAAAGAYTVAPDYVQRAVVLPAQLGEKKRAGYQDVLARATRRRG